MSKKIYAYFFNENNNGIVKTWEECKSLVQGSKARYKSFSNIDEANEWIKSGAAYNKKSTSFEDYFLEEAVYFDAGTGRGRGVEVRIADKYSNSLISVILNENLKKYLEKNTWFVNEFENIELGKEKTNNFGELLGLYLALECAKKLNLKKVLGDSQLVINYWSKGQFQANNLPEETVSLIKKVTENRKKFESNNSEVKYISGDINPADLGFHK
nr:ribonuclease H family protein [Fusobacterium gastrosuis]